MALEIEKNIPIPGSLRRKYPFDKMEVGDSFFAKDAKRGAVYAQAFSFSKANHGKKFVTREVDGGIRCWRVE